MQLTQEDYEDRKHRVDTDQGDDEDRRLVKHYEREGHTVREGGDRPSAGNNSSTSREVTSNPFETSGNVDPSSARTTVNPSKTDRTASSTAASTAGSGKVDPSAKK